MFIVGDNTVWNVTTQFDGEKITTKHFNTWENYKLQLQQEFEIILLKIKILYKKKEIVEIVSVSSWGILFSNS